MPDSKNSIRGGRYAFSSEDRARSLLPTAAPTGARRLGLHKTKARDDKDLVEERTRAQTLGLKRGVEADLIVLIGSCEGHVLHAVLAALQRGRAPLPGYLVRRRNRN